MPILTEVMLTATLNAFGISIVNWIKTVGDLLAEILNNECYLRIGPNGLERVTEIVKMVIVDPTNPKRGVLMEVSKTLPNGTVMKRDREPSGKIKIGKETREGALSRELRSELRLESSEYKFHLVHTTEETGNAKSAYSGLPSVYIIHRYGVFPNADSPVLRDTFTIHDEEDGGEATFAWIVVEKK